MRCRQLLASLTNKACRRLPGLLAMQGRPPGVLGLWPSRAVTFLENHDTGGERRVFCESWLLLPLLVLVRAAQALALAAWLLGATVGCLPCTASDSPPCCACHAPPLAAFLASCHFLFQAPRSTTGRSPGSTCPRATATCSPTAARE